MTLKLLALSLLGLAAFAVVALFAAGLWLLTRTPARDRRRKPRA